MGELKSESYGNASLSDIGNKSYSFTFFSNKDNKLDHIGEIITIGDTSNNEGHSIISENASLGSIKS